MGVIWAVLFGFLRHSVMLWVSAHRMGLFRRLRPPTFGSGWPGLAQWRAQLRTSHCLCLRFPAQLLSCLCQRQSCHLHFMDLRRIVLTVCALAGLRTSALACPSSGRFLRFSKRNSRNLKNWAQLLKKRLSILAKRIPYSAEHGL